MRVESKLRERAKKIDERWGTGGGSSRRERGDTRGDDTAGTTRAVSQLRRNGEHPLFTKAHSHDAFIPSLDHLAWFSKGKRKKKKEKRKKKKEKEKEN